jgi:hypothetical protein
MKSDEEYFLIYSYIGSKDILEQVKSELKGTCIQSISEIEKWIFKTYQKPNIHGEITATFIIDTESNLCISDRHSEHVVCANAKPVLSAGEITFKIINNKVIGVSQVTNQSTGYCPSPKSWKSVMYALKKVGIKHPGRFTTEFSFRVCNICNWINLIKNEYFVCVNCENNLSETEN